MYSLRRESDDAGDSGLMSQARNKDGTVASDRPQVGCYMVVGSPYARTFGDQDYWQTTIIQEILEDEPNLVRFKTRNSVYTWSQH
jgi:hypothetical protein